MPALRLLTPWPWGCPKNLAEVPDGSFRAQPIENNYWLQGSLARVMRWYYQVKTWRLTAQALFALTDSPLGDKMIGEVSFEKATDVVCGRNGLSLIVSGTTPEGRPMDAEIVLFLPTPPNVQGNNNLLFEHSVVKESDTNYAVFCYVRTRFFVTSTASFGFQSNVELTRPWATLTFDGQEVFKRQASQAPDTPFSMSWVINIEPAEFFDFSD